MKEPTASALNAESTSMKSAFKRSLSLSCAWHVNHAQSCSNKSKGQRCARIYREVQTVCHAWQTPLQGTELINSP